MSAPPEPRPLRRIAILIASLQLGGAEKAALGLLEAFLDSGYDARLLALDANRDMLETLTPERLRRLESRIVRLGSADIRRGTVAKVLDGPRQWLALERCLAREAPDVVLSVMERANILNLLRHGGGRRVISVRSHPSELFASKTPLKRLLVSRFYRLLLRRADRIVFVSREAAVDFTRLFPETRDRTAVVYNQCDVDDLRRRAAAGVPAEFAAVFDRPVVIACGRMNAEKGHSSLVRAFAAVSRRDASSRLVLVGAGPLETALRRLVSDLGLAERVVFAGFQPNPPAWIARSCVFVLPSVWEGFPNVLLEALAVGTPVVASDCRSGPREILAPLTDPERKTMGLDRTPFGFLVPAPDAVLRDASIPLTDAERLLARAIEESLADEGLRREATAAADLRVAEFAQGQILPRWIEILGGS